MTDKVKNVFSLAEYNGKTVFTKIGQAFVNRDGSMNVFLDCVPLSGKLHIRDQVIEKENKNG